MNCYVTLPHLFDHVHPIWDALDPSVRGNLYVGFDQSMRAAAVAQGYEPHLGLAPPSDVPVLVASGNDLVAVQHAILAEHGCGQKYNDVNHVSWCGGEGRDNVRLFLCPNDRVASANLHRYPDIPCAIVGSPHVEALRKLPPYPLAEQRIAISGHWESSLVPELRSAVAWFEDAYEKLCRANPDTFVLHGHPRFADWFAWKAREWGVEYVESFADLTQRAWLYICDSSSTMYEWAALGRPVVVVSPPWYRRDVEHGLRFWSESDLGPMVFDPEDLSAAIQVAIADPAPIAQRRQQITRLVFGEDLSAGAAKRAADAISRML